MRSFLLNFIAFCYKYVGVDHFLCVKLLSSGISYMSLLDEESKQPKWKWSVVLFSFTGNGGVYGSQ